MDVVTAYMGYLCDANHKPVALCFVSKDAADVAANTLLCGQAIGCRSGIVNVVEAEMSEKAFEMLQHTTGSCGCEPFETVTKENITVMRQIEEGEELEAGETSIPINEDGSVNVEAITATFERMINNKTIN